MGQEQSGEMEPSELNALSESRGVQQRPPPSPKKPKTRGKRDESLGRLDGNPHEIFQEQSVSSNTTLAKPNGSFSSLSKSPAPPKKSETVSVPFVWRHGGNRVLVTGSFWNWGRQEEMYKQGHEFQRILDLDRGVHQYKFIVDGEWRFAPQQKKCKDSDGNTNNCLDTQQFRAQFQGSQDTKSQKQESCGLTSKGYSMMLPNPADFSANAAVIQPQQHRHFLTFQPPDAKYYKNLQYSPGLPSQGRQSEGLPLPPHSLVNHAAQSRRAQIGGNVVAMTTMSYPVRNKYVTTVYYKYETSE